MILKVTLLIRQLCINRSKYRAQQQCWRAFYVLMTKCFNFLTNFLLIFYDFLHLMDIFWKNCNRVVIQNRLEKGVIRNFTSWNLITRIKIKKKISKLEKLELILSSWIKLNLKTVLMIVTYGLLKRLVR